MEELIDKVCIVNNHKYQREVFLDPARYKIVVSGRQFGKSTLMVEEALKMALEREGAQCYLISPTFNMGVKAFWDKLINRANDLQWDYTTNKHALSLYLKSKGSLIQIASAEKPDRIRGVTLDFAGIDEFREMKENLWHEIVKPALGVRKGRALFCSTPNGHDQVYRLWVIGQDKTQSLYKSWLFKSIDSPFWSEEELADAKKFSDDKSYRQEYEASFEQAEGLVYSAYDRSYNVRPLEIDYNLPLLISFDFNISPMTTSICQSVKGNRERNEQEKVLNVIHTINRDNSNTLKQCQELKTYLEEINYTGELYFYGDSKGSDRKTSSDNTDWEIIRQQFPYSYSRVPRLNPSVSDRINLVNMKLRNADGEIGLFINTKNCDGLIRDFEEMLRKSNGDIDKKKDSSLTHNSDNIGYLVHYEFPLPANRRLIMSII